jgi:DNA repair photolyase
MNYYNSPRWSGEILDCSMPMTFDTYSKCSFNCLYCFSWFQKSHSMREGGTSATQKNPNYQKSEIRHVNVDVIKKIFTFDNGISEQLKQFWPYIRAKKVMQWGGLADAFDMYEKQNEISLELLRFFKSINYPLSFSTKGTWWIYDERYRELFHKQDNWHVKVSIINLDPDKSLKMEKGVKTPIERLELIKEVSKLNKAGVTLRLRPFIIGYTNFNNEHTELIRLAGESGADSISTEFFCLESRADEYLKTRYNEMSHIIGYDIMDFYRKLSKGAGYRRLNYDIKKKYVAEMVEACKKANMRIYISDAHHKEKSCNGSCCGLKPEFNYSRGQFTEALMIAKEKGKVFWKDIEKDIINLHANYKWIYACNFNTNQGFTESIRKNQSMSDYMREQWNNPNSLRSPYKYFQGILIPKEIDDEGNVVYYYNYDKAAL